jgi:hypothetical protein
MKMYFNIQFGAVVWDHQTCQTMISPCSPSQSATYAEQDLTSLASNSQVSLHIHPEKTKILKINTSSTEAVKLWDNNLEEVKSFTYLGSMINQQGGTDWCRHEDPHRKDKSILQSPEEHLVIPPHINSHQNPPVQLQRQISIVVCGRGVANNKDNHQESANIHKFHEYRYWKSAGQLITISNKDLWERTNQVPAEEEIRRRWRWIGHTLRKPPTNITRQALTWNPQGKRERGWLKNSWRRDLEADTKQTGCSWGELERIARDHGQWWAVVLCPTRGSRSK